MTQLEHQCESARLLFDALLGHYRESLLRGRQVSWAKAAHSIVDLLAHEPTARDPWLDWLSENH